MNRTPLLATNPLPDNTRKGKRCGSPHNPQMKDPAMSTVLSVQRERGGVPYTSCDRVRTSTQGQLGAPVVGVRTHFYVDQ